MSAKKTVKDVEDVLGYLQGIVSSTRRGEDEMKIAYPYARTVLQEAEQPLRKLDLYEKASHAIDQSERMILAGQFDEADKLLCLTARELMEISGTNDGLRKLYAPQTSKRQQ